MGHFLFTCSDTLAVRCIIKPQCTELRTDRQTDDVTMPIADRKVVPRNSAIGSRT